MFFMIGLRNGRKNLNYNGIIFCRHCGAYGQCQVFMTYMVLSLFFIPCFKWSKKYFVQSHCCRTIYALDGETGRRIARGENVEILPEHLRELQSGGRNFRHCTNCGFTTEEDFEFCPKCGKRF